MPAPLGARDVRAAVPADGVGVRLQELGAILGSIDRAAGRCGRVLGAGALAEREFLGDDDRRSRCRRSGVTASTEYMRTLEVFCILAMASRAGAQWAPQASGTSAEFRGLSAVSPSVVWASGTRGRFVRTTDGGATWMLDSIAGADSLDLRAIVARDASHAWAISSGPAEQGQAKIFRTQDGAHWARVFE